MKKGQKYKQFICQEGSFVPTTSLGSVSKLEAGAYTLSQDMNGNVIFSEKEIITDDFIEMPSMNTTQVINEINVFWDEKTREKFKEFGVVYKRGVLLHGVPGTGKTCTVFKAIKHVIELGGIAIYNPHPVTFSKAIQAMREIQGNCKVVCVFEEFDQYKDKSDFLSLLDGELQVDNVLYLATTNYIDRIEDNLKKRPSRFARVIEVGKPDFDARLEYIRRKMPNLTDKDVVRWAKKTDGFVLDQIKDTLISVECFGYTFEDASSTIKELGAKTFGLAQTEESNDEDEGDF